MPSQVTDVHVRRVSFVKRASTRDPNNPTEPRRHLLYKAEGAATATPPAPYVETATDRKARRLSKACDLMHEEIETMRGNGTPGAVIRAHEQAYGRMHIELVALHDPAAARRLRGEPDDDNTTERTTTMPADLLKRAIGSDGATPAGSGLPTLQEIETKQENMTGLLGDLYDDLRRMRRDPQTAPHVLDRHQRAYAALTHEYKALDGMRGLHEAAVARAGSDGEPAAIAKAAQLQKSDRTLSAADAFRAAMRDPETLAQYYRESGTAPPAPSTSHQLAKAAGDTSYAEHGAAVDEVASYLEKSEGLSPTAAYRKALAAAGVLAAA